MPELIRLIFQGKSVIFWHYVGLLVEGLEDHEVGAVSIRTHLGDLERAKAAREGKLRFIGDVLVAKDQNRVLLERHAHRRVCGLACRNVVDGHSTQFGSKAWTQRQDFHRRTPCIPRLSTTFHQKRAADKQAGSTGSKPRQALRLQVSSASEQSRTCTGDLRLAQRGSSSCMHRKRREP